jgi:predicted Zn-dependent peptidase
MTQVSRKYTCSLLLSFVFLAASAQKQPYEMTVSGVKVIVQPSDNEIVVIQSIVKGGVQNYPANKAGIESVAFMALTECGTKNDSKNSFKNKLDKVSAQIYGSSSFDYASLTMNCIRGDFETVWPLYVDALTAPAFDSREFERIKQDAINNLKAQASTPDYSIALMARQAAFAGKDYAKTPEGTEATVKPLTAAETQAYYKSILTRSRLLIVVVGEIERPDLEAKLTRMLSAVPQGRPFTQKKESFTPKQTTFTAAKKELATNYIQGVTSGPLPGTKDYNAFLLAMRIFYNRNFLEVRTNNGLSYAPSAFFNGGMSPYAGLGVSTTEPNKYIAVVDELVNRTKKTGFTEDEVRDMKSTYITSFFSRQETNSAQAAAFAANEVLHNNWRRSLTLNDDLKKLTVADINKVFNQYFGALTWVYQGNPTKADPSLFTKQPRKLPPSTMGNKKMQ